MFRIEKRGFDAVQAKLKKAQDARMITPAVEAALDILRQEAMKFPPIPPRPPVGTNTWVRERGQFSVSAFVGPRGKRAKPNLRAGKMYRASEMMLAKWKNARAQISQRGNQIIGRITNAASYGVFVQGERQTRVMRRIGWKTTREIQAKHAARVKKVFADALARLMDELQ